MPLCASSFAKVPPPAPEPITTTTESSARIILDNIENIQASWVTQGDKVAQVALFFGANDLGGTMLEENVVAAAGVDFRLSQTQIIDLVRDAGFTPARRTTNYTILEEY